MDKNFFKNDKMNIILNLVWNLDNSFIWTRDNLSIN